MRSTSSLTTGWREQCQRAVGGHMAGTSGRWCAGWEAWCCHPLAVRCGWPPAAALRTGTHSWTTALTEHGPHDWTTDRSGPLWEQEQEHMTRQQAGLDHSENRDMNTQLDNRQVWYTQLLVKLYDKTSLINSLRAIHSYLCSISKAYCLTIWIVLHFHVIRIIFVYAIQERVSDIGLLQGEVKDTGLSDNTEGGGGGYQLS